MGKTMNQLVGTIVTESNLSEKQVRAVLKSLIGTVQTELATEGGFVTIPGLGTFRSVKKGGRDARNPRTGTTSWVAEYLKPTFKASSAMRDAVNGVAGGADAEE